MHDTLLRDLEAMVLCHGPSGNEAEIDRWLMARWQDLGLEFHQDAAGRVRVTNPSRPPPTEVTGGQTRGCPPRLRQSISHPRPGETGPE